MIKFFIRLNLITFVILINLLLKCYAAENLQMSAEKSKQLVKDAVIYALENMDPNMDYSKYVSKNFINHVDDNVFNFNEWVKHQKDIKAIVKSMKPTFDLLVAEKDYVAAIYRIHIIKKDGSELDVKDMGFFKIKNHTIVYVDELTRLINGNKEDSNIGSMK